MAVNDRQVGGASAEELDRKRQLENAKRSQVQIPSSGGSSINHAEADRGQTNDLVESLRDPRVKNKTVARVAKVKRDAENRSLKRATQIGKKYGEDIVMKYGWKEFDSFMMGFCFVTTISLVGILLAILAILVLDIRWVVGHVSKKVPKMDIPHAVLLGALNFTLIIILIMIFVLFVAVYCISVAPGDIIDKLASGATGLNIDIFDSCF